jgi:geranylgeranyl diphosphate synthase type II
MCGQKTAWYTTIQPLAIGALVGSGDAGRERETFRFAWLLGLLFQIANDLDGIRPDAGKSEIEEGKRTILVIHLLGALSGPDRDEAVRIMRLPRDQRRGPEVEWVRGKMETEGSVEHARDCVSELAVAARREADAVFLELPRSEARDLLRQSTDYVLEQHGLP